MEPTGTIREYKPTWRERAANALADLVEGMGADRWKANKIAQTLLGGERSNLPAGMGLSDLAAFGVVPRAPAALRAASVPAGLLNYADASKEGNPFSALTVWHGSPHKFDKFDSAHIGRGEGAQAYGHGLYFAENPEVAASYSPNVPGRYVTKAGSDFKPRDGYEDAMLTLVSQYKTAENALKAMGPNVPPSIKEALESMIAHGVSVQPASKAALYKVDLPDNLIARMLDWDKPLSQQAPEVLAALPQFANRGVVSGGKVVEMTGEDIVRELGRTHAGSLQGRGIPGIRYLDGGSRGAGQGTYNYVVFPGEENALTILERNGNPIQRLAR